MQKIILSMLVLLLAFMLPTISANAYETSAVNTDCIGSWEGQWRNQTGHVFIADMQLQTDKNGRISGEIHWVFQQSPDADEQSKLGMSAIEMVSGHYDPDSRVLVLEGIGKNDSNGIIGLDKYKLLLADNSDVLGGITWNHGDWLGTFSLKRANTINPEYRE
jgi:hypothetical protein